MVQDPLRWSTARVGAGQTQRETPGEDERPATEGQCAAAESLGYGEIECLRAGKQSKVYDQGE